MGKNTMDTRDGRIYTEEEIRKAHNSLVQTFRNENYLMEMAVKPTEKQMARRPPKVGRNEPCPCGSGKKFKKCCLGRKIA